MSYNEQLEEQYECFEGSLRKLDELVSQLELWSDEYTINHKKEDVKLIQYVELHNNLENLKDELQAFLAEREQEGDEAERLNDYSKAIAEKLANFEETQEHIHNWIREIKNIQVIVMRSDILQENQDFINDIINR